MSCCETRKPAHLKYLQDPRQGIQLGLTTVSETITPVSLEVIGELPSYLGEGAYFRNGPGVFEVTHQDGQIYEPDHWCDGIAVIHAFYFDAENGTVRYRSKMISEATIRAIQSVPKDNYVGMTISHRYRPKSFLAHLRWMFSSFTKDPQTGQVPYNNVVSFEYLPGKGYLNARTDANSVHRLDPNTLDTLEVFNFSQFNDKLSDSVSCAHGAYDASTGEYFNFTSHYGIGKVNYNIFRIDSTGKGEMMNTFKAFPYFIHSFALTEKYVIMIMWPCHVQFLRLLKGKSFLEAIKMKEDTRTNFVVISRISNEVVATYQHDPFFSFHIFAAFEQGDDIIVDLSSYKNESIIKELRLDALKAGQGVEECSPVRYTLSKISEETASGPDFRPRAKFKKLADLQFEFGSIAPIRERKPYRYAYGISKELGAVFWGTIVKLDTHTGQHLSWRAPNSFIGEPIFVPDPDGTAEDDGCVLVLVLDTTEEKSCLVVLDARDMTEIARAIAPQPIPHGLHGTFVGQDNLRT